MLGTYPTKKTRQCCVVPVWMLCGVMSDRYMRPNDSVVPVWQCTRYEYHVVHASGNVLIPGRRWVLKRCIEGF